jgi:hypothetical protein
MEKLTNEFADARKNEAARIEKALAGIGYKVISIHIGNLLCEKPSFSISAIEQESSDVKVVK